jgi:hypothetical protein
MKVEKLLKYVEEKHGIPNKRYEEGGVKLGQFWTNIKQGHNKDIYDNILSKNETLKDDYEKTEKLREEKKNKKQYTVDDKVKKLIDYVNEHKIVPTAKYEEYGVKLGKFWTNIKQGKNKDKYDNILSKNETLKDDYEKTKNKKQYTVDDKVKKLIDYVEKHGIPTFNYEEDGVKLGIFWNSIKQGYNKDKLDYILSKNETLKDDYEKIAKALLAFVELESRLPEKSDKKCENANLYAYWNNIKKKGKNIDLYNSILSQNAILKNDYEQTQ